MPPRVAAEGRRHGVSPPKSAAKARLVNKGEQYSMRTRRLNFGGPCCVIRSQVDHPPCETPHGGSLGWPCGRVLPGCLDVPSRAGAHRDAQKHTEAHRNAQKRTETHRNAQKRAETHRNAETRSGTCFWVFLSVSVRFCALLSVSVRFCGFLRVSARSGAHLP